SVSRKCTKMPSNSLFSVSRRCQFLTSNNNNPNKKLLEPYFRAGIYLILPHQKYGKIVYSSYYHEQYNTMPLDKFIQTVKKVIEHGNKIRVEEGLKPID
ncbi:MAG: hypothetical protein JXA60_01620, partial [Candidatus Coatesbacteria bacterium]|nr:hypothetical protein [Candidatus Coatesbacteria bacterium]